MRIKKFLGNRKNHKFIIPIIAIILGFALGSLILLFTGEDIAILLNPLLELCLA